MLRTMAALLTIAIASPGVAAETSNAQVDIRATIQAYVDGYNSRDRTLLTRAFDVERGHVKSLVKVDEGADRIRVTAVSDWIEKVTADGPERGVEVRILSITVINDHIANAFLDFDGSLYDMMLVGKIDGTWKILNKVSIYQEPDRR